MRRTALLVACAALEGCVSISDVDMSKAEPSCARECTGRYSMCISAPAIGTPTALFYQCKQALSACVGTCPPKP